MPEDRQYELAGLLFGDRTPLMVTDFDLGAAEWDVQDANNPTTDGTYMGRDYLRPPQWTFTLGTDGQDDVEASALLASLTRAWRTAAPRSTPGAVCELRYGLAGQRRTVFGRPRRFAPIIGGAPFEQGFASAVADFQLVDALHYDTAERSTEIGMRVTSEGGWVWPATFPIITAGSGQREGVIEDVGGDAPTPVVVTIFGPIVNPWIAGPGWRLDLTTTLAYDQSLTVDARPWVNTVIRSDGASLGGALSRTSRLSQARLAPGSSVLSFGGSDPTATAHAVFVWRPAFHSI